LGSECAYFAPKGAERAAKGAINIRPNKLTYPRDPGGKLATNKPVRIKNNVPGIDRKKPSPAEVPTAL